MKVDKHIRRLDSDLSRFEQELKLKEPGLRRTSISSIAEMAPPTLPSSKSRDFLIIGNFQKYWKLSNSVPLIWKFIIFEIILCSIYANVKFNVHIGAEGRKRSTTNEVSGGSRKKKLTSTSEEPRYTKSDLTFLFFSLTHT